MWKAHLLILIGVQPGPHLTKDTFLYELHLLLVLLTEDAGNEVWLVLWLLCWKQIVNDLWPLWVASQSDKKVWSPKASHICHGITLLPIHVAWPPM